MKEEDYISKLSDIDEHEDVPEETLALADQAVQAFPEAERLWLLRGDLILLGVKGARRIEEAKRSYLKAIELAPEDPEGHESMGYYMDLIEERSEEAETYFRKAIARGGGAGSYTGLAIILAQRGRRQEALDCLSEGHCPFSDSEEVNESIREINEGMWDP